MDDHAGSGGRGAEHKQERQSEADDVKAVSALASREVEMNAFMRVTTCYHGSHGFRV